MRRGRTKKMASVPVVASIAAIVATITIAIYGGWELFHPSPDLEWASASTKTFAPVEAALSKYYIEHGHYPRALTELRLQDTPSGDSTRSPEWNYEPSKDGQSYRVWLTTHHWVSSFDVFVFESSGDYSEWEGCLEVIPVGRWRYVEGGSDALK